MWKEKLEDSLALSETHMELIKHTYDFISRNDNFIIFGASSGGAKAKALLDNLGKHVAYFVDNDINKQGTDFLGKVVRHPSEILMFEHKVIIASAWWFDIQTQLEVYMEELKIHYKDWWKKIGTLSIECYRNNIKPKYIVQSV